MAEPLPDDELLLPELWPSLPPPRARRIRELPASERPRERLALRGPGGLSAAELVAIVWGSGSAGRSATDLATEALARFDGVTGLARATDSAQLALRCGSNVMFVARAVWPSP